MAITEAQREASRRWREANRERHRAANLEYYYSNRAKMLEGNKQWREINKERRATQLSEYAKSQAGKAIRANIRHRRRQVERSKDTTVSTEDLTRVLAARTCYLCGAKFTKDNPATIDHIVAIADGGKHEIANLAAAHQACNLKKGKKRANPHTGQGILL